MQDDNPWGAWVKRQDDEPEDRGSLFTRKSDATKTPTNPQVSGPAVRGYLDRICGWRPIDLADETGKSRPFIAKLLRGERNPKGDDLTNLAYVLRVKIEWLYLDEPTPYKDHSAWHNEVRDRVRQELIDLAAVTEPVRGMKKLDEPTATRIGRREGIHFNMIRDWFFREANEIPTTVLPPLRPVPPVEVLEKHVDLAPESPSGLVWAESHPCAGEIAGEPGKIAAGTWIVRLGGGRWPAKMLVEALAGVRL